MKIGDQIASNDAGPGGMMASITRELNPNRFDSLDLTECSEPETELTGPCYFRTQFLAQCDTHKHSLVPQNFDMCDWLCVLSWVAVGPERRCARAILVLQRLSIFED